MGNLDIQEFYRLEYVLDDEPNILPIRYKNNKISNSKIYFYTLTLDTYEHCRHR